MEFPVNQSTTLIKKYKDNKAFISKAKTMAEAAKPEQFTEKVKWVDWNPTFINFLNSMPGRHGIPLGYICREVEEPQLAEDPTSDMFSNLIKMTRLEGDIFALDAAEVHTYIMRFITGNSVAEAKVLSHNNQGNGRADYIALKQHYEGVGFHSIEIQQAERTLQSLYYAGEKKPLMDWAKFEKELNLAFAVMERKYGNVYDDERKLRLLMTKTTRADNISHMRTVLDSQLAAVPVTLTYNQAMTAFRNVVNAKAPPDLNNNTRSRRIQQSRKRGNNNDDKGRSKRGKKSHPDAQMITMKDGTTKEIHASYRLTPKDWENMPDQVAARIKRERNAWKERTGKGRGYHTSATDPSQNNVTVNSVVTGQDGNQYIQVPLQQYIQATQQTTQQPPVLALPHSTTPNSHQGIMGGRNEQANLRSRNTQNS